MKNKILIPSIIIAALAAFFSFKYIGGDSDGGDTKRKVILNTTMRVLNDGHFSPRDINDSFSDRIYHTILDRMDYDKKIFSKKDIDLLSQYEYKIDDEIKGSSFEFFDAFNGLFTKDIDRAEKYYTEILAKPFSFTSNEQIQLSGDSLSFAKDEKDLEDRWRRYLKYRVLAKYVDLKDNREKTNDSLKNKKKTDAELEVDARESIKKNMDLYFKRLRKIDDSQRFAIYMNAITNNEDPHTDYFPPQEKQRFDESMSGSFYGIGAQLGEDNGKIKVVAIITGSPCWKQGDLKANDVIEKVGQGSNEPVEVTGFEIEDVVKLIRGKKGTEVRLTVKKVDGATKVIPIIRGEVLLEEKFAKSAIINSKEGPIGYIYLPEFYADFNHTSGRRCAEDVAIEVEKLKTAGIKGLILDLRYNGGGSLSDVVDMAGLFIDRGPIVQVKSNNSAPIMLKDNNRGLLYDGPMAVMVNEGSASASEIMAAALQDYKRAVIVGSPTFGKGTVQKLVSLDDFVDPITKMKLANENTADPKKGMVFSANQEQPGSIGSLKITIQKFYRVNGASTQLKGVVPDIILPDPYSEIDLGERKDKAALPYDEIPAADYEAFAKLTGIKELRAASEKRVAANPVFSLIQKNAGKLKEQQEDNTYSLNEAAYRKEIEEANTTSKKIEALQKEGAPLTITNPKADLSNINRDSSSIAKNADWIKNLKKDIYLSETVNIITDVAKQQGVAVKLDTEKE